MHGLIVRLPPLATISGAGTTDDPYNAAWSVGNQRYALALQTASAASISECSRGRAWVRAYDNQAMVQRVQAVTINGVTGYNVSFQSADVQAGSAVATLFNKNGLQYAIIIKALDTRVDLLSKSSEPPLITQVQDTILLITPIVVHLRLLPRRLHPNLLQETLGHFPPKPPLAPMDRVKSDRDHSGHGAVWLARLHGVQEVYGSNPYAPTNNSQLSRFAYSRVCHAARMTSIGAGWPVQISNAAAPWPINMPAPPITDKRACCASCISRVVVGR